MVKTVKVKLFFSIEYVVFYVVYHTSNVPGMKSIVVKLTLKLIPVDEIMWNYGMV